MCLFLQHRSPHGAHSSRVAATTAAAVRRSGISIVTLRHACTDRCKPKPGQPATCLMALSYVISHQWYHSYTVHFGLYVGVLPVAQADLHRLRRQTSHCKAVFAYLTYPKYIFTLFVRGRHLSNMFTMPQLKCLVCRAAHRVLAMKDVYICLWRTHNTIERHIYTPVAVDVLKATARKLQSSVH